MASTHREPLAGHMVIKIGSAVFLRGQSQIDRPAFASLVAGIDELLQRGLQVTLVSSGAVAMGRQLLQAPVSREIPLLQAYAALGQARLMKLYEDEFHHYGRHVAQVLFSRGDLSDRRRYLNARQTLRTLEELGAVAIINENDTVATEELRFGDNDQLAAMATGLVGAQTLVLLSDVEGLKEVHLEKGTRHFGDIVDEISVDDPRLDQWAGPSTSGLGRGGMISKVEAARTAARSGAFTIIAPGKQSDVLQGLASGEKLGTRFLPLSIRGVGGKKVWIGGGALPAGKIHCDEGAVRAVQSRGASLLPSGITSVEGRFGDGDVVELMDHNGEVFARGIAAYSSEDLQAIAGEHSSQIEERLGFFIIDAAVHRDNLLVLS